MNRKTIILLPVLISASLFSQQAIVSSGNLANANGVHLSWSIGETVVETVDGGGATLTQGFQQSNIFISAISEKEISNYRVFPNPVKNQFTIELMNGENEENVKAFLFNLDGKLIKEVQLSSFSTVVYTDDLSAGSYLLQITTETKNKTFKIIKTN